MTATYRGQGDIARWCNVAPAVVSQWVVRHPDSIPEPDVTVEIEGSERPVRGWLPTRRPEWEKFAADRKNAARGPGKTADRARRTAELIRQGVQEGRIDAAEGVRLLRELI